MAKIKKGDHVIVISGKDKGKKGKVLKIIPKKNQLVVEGINIRKKHQRARTTRSQGQIIEFSAPLNISNVKLICPQCSMPTRVGYSIVEKKKYRMCKKCKSTF